MELVAAGQCCWPQVKRTGYRGHRNWTQTRHLGPQMLTDGGTSPSRGEPMGPPFFAGWFPLHSWSVGGAIPGAAGERPGDLPSGTFLKMRLSRAPLPHWGREGGCFIFYSDLPSVSPVHLRAETQTSLCICRFLHLLSGPEGRLGNFFFFFLKQ